MAMREWTLEEVAALRVDVRKRWGKWSILFIDDAGEKPMGVFTCETQGMADDADAVASLWSQAMRFFTGKLEAPEEVEPREINADERALIASMERDS